jgi:hypothetical protein
MTAWVPLDTAPPLLPPPPRPSTVNYWTKADFDANHGPAQNGRAYFEEFGGKIMSDTRYGEVTETIRRSFFDLRKAGEAPLKFSEIGTWAWEWLKATVYAAHPEMQMCEADWRLRWWCTGNYPSWASTHLRHYVPPWRLAQAQNSDMPIHSDIATSQTLPAKLRE